MLGTDRLTVKAEAMLPSHLRDFHLLPITGHCPHQTNEGTKTWGNRVRRQERPRAGLGTPTFPMK